MAKPITADLRAAPRLTPITKFGAEEPKTESEDLQRAEQLRALVLVTQNFVNADGTPTKDFSDKIAKYFEGPVVLGTAGIERLTGHFAQSAATGAIGAETTRRQVEGLLALIDSKLLVDPSLETGNFKRALSFFAERAISYGQEHLDGFETQ